MKSSHLEQKAVSEITAVATTWPKDAAANKIVLVVIFIIVIVVVFIVNSCERDKAF